MISVFPFLEKLVLKETIAIHEAGCGFGYFQAAQSAREAISRMISKLIIVGPNNLSTSVYSFPIIVVGSDTFEVTTVGGVLRYCLESERSRSVG